MQSVRKILKLSLTVSQDKFGAPQSVTPPHPPACRRSDIYLVDTDRWNPQFLQANPRPAQYALKQWWSAISGYCVESSKKVIASLCWASDMTEIAERRNSEYNISNQRAWNAWQGCRRWKGYNKTWVDLRRQLSGRHQVSSAMMLWMKVEHPSSSNKSLHQTETETPWK